MLGIVERILAALIILALLTLLIILAFPVPPRAPVAPGSGDQQAARQPETVTTPPTGGQPGTTTAPKADGAPKARSAPPPSAAPTHRKLSDRLPETRSQVPYRQAESEGRSNRGRVWHGAYPPPARAARRASKQDPLLAEDCAGPECDCCCDTRERPYWAAGPRSYLVDRDNDQPYWAPRRERLAQAPAGTCAE